MGNTAAAPAWRDMQERQQQTVVCVAGGRGWFLAAADEAHLLAISPHHPFHKDLVCSPLRRQIIPSYTSIRVPCRCVSILVSSGISKPARTLPPQPASASPVNKLCSLILNYSFMSALGSKLYHKPNSDIHLEEDQGSRSM
ncbi:unnamed protein product [Pleuronectes platessa]|uniref:Uncharacterized protein n=1 Tax=Pleuronectes platessa TaxID=8262 RepID=A0A9N7VHF7_PLEPL|nr:unnamed protein product [Pleuronectes platessa]